MENLFKSSGQSQGVEQKKISQKKLIIRTIYFNGPVSNAELARNLLLSTPKINSLLQEMIAEGLVKELGPGDSSGGRRPAIYGLVEDGFYVVGITMNIKRSIISIFNSNNREIAPPQFFPVKMQPDFQIFHQLNVHLNEVLEQNNIPKDKVIAVGMELPGLVNQTIGINKTYFPDIENLDQEIAKIFGLPVFFDNDAKIRTFAEQQFGLAKGRKQVLMLHIDWGVGLGLILNGELYSGKSGFSGEFGHIPMVENGLLCQCGKKGCLETIASVMAIARMAREGLEAGNSSLLSNLVDNNLDKIDPNTVIQAAQDGDQFCISILTEVGYWLGRGITHLIQIFNPELIIIGGKVAEAGQFLTAPIHQAIFTYSNRDISNDTEIMFSAMGTRAGTIGAAAFAVEKLANS